MNLDQYQLLSFDCYGTLIDWESGLLAAFDRVLTRHGVPYSSEALLELYGRLETEIEAAAFRPYREVLWGVLEGVGREYGFTPSTEELERFSQCVVEWPPFADTVAALRALGARYQLVVLSNIDEDHFRGSEAQLGVRFDHVFTAQRIGSYKPSLQNFRFLVEHCAVAKDQILHVAQSLFHDIAPAKELGLSTVWVNRRAGRDGGGATPPSSAEPDLEVPDLQSLADMVAKA